MIKKIGIVLLLLIIAILIYASTKPDTFNIRRSIKIKAKGEKIFLLINDFKNWNQWSPYDKLDPNMKRTFGPVTQGVGASYTWTGTGAVGSGSMSIVQSSAPHLIALNLEMLTPFKASNFVEFILDQVGDDTDVTWSMTGKNVYISKLVGLIMNMDKMVGSQFEEGLLNLKTIAEK